MIVEVNGLPKKLEGAASAHMRTMLVPKGQGRTQEWDLFELGRQYDITVMEVASLLDAYELMVVKRP
jgi:predicted S18 family serine protease